MEGAGTMMDLKQLPGIIFNHDHFVMRFENLYELRAIFSFHNSRRIIEIAQFRMVKISFGYSLILSSGIFKSAPIFTIIIRGLCRTPYVIPIRPTGPVECHNVAPAGRDSTGLAERDLKR